MIQDIDVEVADYLRRNPDDRGRLTLLLDQLAGDPAYHLRSNMRGHVVSSIITLDRTRRRALLILHGAYGLWIPPGGHYEEPGTARDSAIRELAEETGLRGTRPAGGRPFLLDIDTHPIPARPEKGEGPHFHHDLMYLELLDEEFDPTIQEEEVDGAAWRDLDDLLQQDGRMSRLVSRILALPASMLD